MLRTGTSYLEALRDGRCIYIGGERVDDVTSHPAFRNTAHSFAEIYDRKRALEHQRSRACRVVDRKPLRDDRPHRVPNHDRGLETHRVEKRRHVPGEICRGIASFRFARAAVSTLRQREDP